MEVVETYIVKLIFDIIHYIDYPSGSPSMYISARSVLLWIFGDEFKPFLISAAIVSASACGLTMIFSSDPGVIDSSKKWLVNIVFGIAIYFGARKWLIG